MHDMVASVSSNVSRPVLDRDQAMGKVSTSGDAESTREIGG